MSSGTSTTSGKASKVVVAMIILATTLGFHVSGANAADSRTFPETGRTVAGRFLKYWDANGGLAQQGFPISEEMQETSDVDGNTYTVQYFERAVFEMHPEQAPPYDVLLSLLGTSNYNEKYGGDAPDQVPSTDNPLTFPETGKTLGGVFRTYWETHGGLAQQGFPISDEFQEPDKDGNLRTVQYFERAVFEYHEEFAGTENEVLLSLLGNFFYAQKYAQGGTPPPSGGVPGGSLKIVALGDSLTEGEGDVYEGGGYPARLLALVRGMRPDTEMINLGVSGWTSQQMNQGQLPEALAAKPNIALVWIGSNDLWQNNGPEQLAADVETYTNNIDTALRSLTGVGVRVYIALLDDQSLRPYAKDPNLGGFYPEQLVHMSNLANAFNVVIRAKATQYGATTVDFHNTTIFTDPATLAEDGLHPNQTGYDAIAKKWFAAIQKHVQGSTPQSGGVPGGSLKIVAVGDSLTEGMGDMPEGGGYPSRLLKSVRTIRSDAQMINLGVSGWTSSQMVEEQVPVAVKAKPEIALVWIGGNNLWYNNGPEGETDDLNIFRTDIDTTLSTLTATGAKTFISLVYDQTKSPYTTSPNGAALDVAGVAHMSHLVTEFNKIIMAKAKQYGATTVDMYSNTTIFANPATLAEDEAHPNAAGYDLIAQIWFEAIKPVLK